MVVAYVEQVRDFAFVCPSQCEGTSFLDAGSQVLLDDLLGPQKTPQFGTDLLQHEADDVVVFSHGRDFVGEVFFENLGNIEDIVCILETWVTRGFLRNPVMCFFQLFNGDHDTFLHCWRCAGGD